MACDSAGAPSERKNVVADPLTAAKPMVPDGLAAPVILDPDNAPVAVIVPVAVTLPTTANA